MRTLLATVFLFALAQLLPAQNFEGMAYVKAGGELIGPVQVKQNVGGSISIGQWPKTTFFVFDEYTAVLDENKNLVLEGGLPAYSGPGEKFLAEKEKWLNADFSPTQEEQTAPKQEEESVTTETSDSSEPKKKNTQKKKKVKKEKNQQPDIINTQPLFPEGDTSSGIIMGDREPRLGVGLIAGHFRTGAADGIGYGITVNRSYPVCRKFRIGASADAVVFHDYIFKKTGTQYYYDDMGYPVEEESYKYPEGFAGALQLRPFAGFDFGCVRAGYQPIIALNYHSVWGTDVEVFPIGVGVDFLRGPVQVGLFAAMKLNSSMYYGRMRVFGASVTLGNRTGNRTH